MPGLRPTSIPVRAYRCLRLGFHFLWIAAGAALIYPCVGEKQRDRLKQRWSHQTLRILAIRLDLEPTDAPPGSLIVANHVSWLDIFVINALRPSAFVSKSEVRAWPFIGWLAAKNDTVFLRRGSRGHAKVVNEEIDGRLNSGKDVSIFPEGTTTDGTHLLGFHAALLQPAVETGRPVLPLAISYHDETGKHTTGPAFAGEATLIDSLSAVLASRALIAHLTPSPAIATKGRTRRDVVRAAHEAIADALSTRLGSPLSSTEPEKQPDPPA